jgi:hypothetical protein
VGTEPLQEEIRSVGWNDTRDDHHESQPDHACDAAHYGLELASAIGVMAAPVRPEKGSPEWYAAEEEKMRAMVFAQNQERRRRR